LDFLERGQKQLGLLSIRHRRFGFFFGSTTGGGAGFCLGFLDFFAVLGIDSPSELRIRKPILA
jgi:hypothetical protein